MGELYIEGGKPLSGTVRIQGSKNAALPFMAAALLCRGRTTLQDCPQISDVFYMEKILHTLGARSHWEGHNLFLDTEKICADVVLPEYTGTMRSSVLLLGPLLALNGKAVLGYPGGCTIGKRPIDLHLSLLEKMGARIFERGRWICAEAAHLKGTEIIFRKRSVGATEQGILSAVCAEGKTTLFFCAREPEIVWLCRFLRKMGAKISGEGSDIIIIEGKKELYGKTMEVPPDRIVAGTYLCACAATRGRIELEHVPFEEMKSFLEVYKKIGGQYKHNSGKLLADSVGLCQPVSFLETDIYPGFPTDLQSPLLAVLATINGRSCICENIFENRFQTAEELRKMGAKIRTEGNMAEIYGGEILRGCEVRARDLRGGAALVIAGLAAEGMTTVGGYSYIQRGYENIAKDIRALGGRIRENSGTEIYGE